MTDRDKVTELLKNYRSYRYAVSNGIASHDPSESLGIRSGYGPRAPIAFGERGNTIQSAMDFRQYSRAVTMIDGAVEDVLDDDERDVIRFKYLERNTMTLERIAERKHQSDRTIKRTHKRALTKLTVSLRFVEVPEIINLDEFVSISV